MDDDDDASPAVGVSGRRRHRAIRVAVAAAVLPLIVVVVIGAAGEPEVSLPQPTPTATGVLVAPTTPSDLFTEVVPPGRTDRNAHARATSTVVRASPVSTTLPTGDVVPSVTAPPLPVAPAVVARPIPVEAPPAPAAPPAPWAASVAITAGGHVSTDVGCAVDVSAPGLDAFFAERIGPVIGWDYQHVYPLGGNRHLWLFQDTFVDHSNTVTTLDAARFVHNAALIQDGNCFRLLHGGSVDRPESFEQGTGTATLSTWFWPMGGEVHDGRLHVFWVRMVKDVVDPPVPNGLGWHPGATYVATYDPDTLARIDFRPATQPGTSPIYGYAVQSDAQWTYLFGNSFEQNLSREGGWAAGPHSATRMYLARVPRGAVFDQPTYWTAAGWNNDRRVAEPFLQRHWAEFPFQPRLLDDRWVAVTAVDGYWGDALEIDVANQPWGPWTTVESRPLSPRGADPKKNTYHAHLVPWRDGAGNLVVTVSNNARDMRRDAWPNPSRYRPAVSASPWRDPPAPTTTVPPTRSTTIPPTTSTTIPPTTSTVIATTTSTTTSTAPTTTMPSSGTTSSSTTSTSSTSPSTTEP